MSCCLLWEESPRARWARELNLDADRLSHPSMAATVGREASGRELEVVWVEPMGELMGAAEKSGHTPLGL